MAGKEGILLKKFLLEYSRCGNRLFRANSGLAWTGKTERFNQKATVTVNPGDVVIRKARAFHGMPKGTSDLIGWTEVTISHDMVGRKVAVFTGYEVKTGRIKTTKEQLNFIKTVLKHGGIAATVRKIDDIFNAINIFNKGEQDGKGKTRH